MHGLHPEGKHLACRRRQPDLQTVIEPAIARRLIAAVITEMISADMMCVMLIGAITGNVSGQDKTIAVAITQVAMSTTEHCLYQKTPVPSDHN